MKNGRAALLVSDQEGTSRVVARAFEERGVQVRVAHRNIQVHRVLNEFALAGVAFSYTTLLDGSWTHSFYSARVAQRPLPTIIASRVVNADHYITALGKGASDFAVWLFYCQDIARVLCGAVQNSFGMLKLPAKTSTIA